MIHVYIDTGGLAPAVRALERAGLLHTYHYPFENRNAKVTTIVPGAGATWDQSEHVTWDTDPGTWDDAKPSDLFEPLRRAVGGHRVDAQYLDSAFKAGCTHFLTSDKGDIWSQRAAILELTGIVVLHMPSQVAELEAICSNSQK